MKKITTKEKVAFLKEYAMKKKGCNEDQITGWLLMVVCSGKKSIDRHYQLAKEGKLE